MATARKKVPTVQMIRVDRLVVDDNYQRRLDEKDVQRIVDDHDPRLFRPLDVSHRSGGKYAVMDGQHRLAAAKVLGLTEVPCRVHSGLNDTEEAELFLRFDEGVRGIRAFDRFHAGVKAEREVPVEVMRIIDRLGLTVTAYHKDFSITATAALEGVHRKYKNLERTLNILTDWMGGAPDAYEGTFITDVGAFLAEHPDAADERVVQALRKAVSPRELKRLVKAMKMDLGCSRRAAAVRTLRRLYNDRAGRKYPKLVSAEAL